jgi:hypothetical protein
MQEAPGIGVKVRVGVAVGGRVFVGVEVGPTAPTLATKVMTLLDVKV